MPACPPSHPRATPRVTLDKDARRRPKSPPPDGAAGGRAPRLGRQAARRLLPAPVPLPDGLHRPRVRALPPGLRGDGAPGRHDGDRDPVLARGALRAEGRPRPDRDRGRRRPVERLRLAAAVPARDHPRGGARRHRRLRQPRGLAAPRPDPRAGPHRAPRGVARALGLRAEGLRPRAVPLPEHPRHVVDDRGPRHLRGDRAHRLRPRPQPRLPDGDPHGGARGALPEGGPGDLRARLLARRPGPVRVR